MTLAKRLWHFHRQQVARLAKEGKIPNLCCIEGRFVFLVTTRCNFRCRHCMRVLEDPKDIPLEIAVKALEAGQKYNLRAVVFTGGEPFLYPRYEELTGRAVALGYRVGIVTNGYNLLEHADFLRRYKKSIDFLAFSLESADAEEHDTIRHKGSFERLMADFDFCRKEKITFRFQTAVSRRNIDDLLAIGLLAKKKRVPAVSFTTMLPCPRTQENELVLDAERRKELVYDLMALGRMLKLRIGISSDIHANTNVALCHAMQMREIAIDAEGRMIQCCELGDFDDPHIRRFAAVADLKTDSFDEAMKKLYGHMHRFACDRISDYARLKDRDEGPDFNSCFYCINKILAQPDASP